MRLIRFPSNKQLRFLSTKNKLTNKWICECERSGNYICESEYCGTCAKSRLKKKLLYSNPKDPNWNKLQQLYKEMIQYTKTY
jgi:hypothetical protein